MKRTMLFVPLKTKRAFEEVSEQIKELIFTGVFSPGDKLPAERELAAQFAVGRIVVREALRVLENSGFVYIKQGSDGGAVVKEIGAAPVTQSIADMVRLGKISFDHLAESRLAIEKMILQFVVRRADEEDLRLLRENIEQSEKVLLTGVRATETNVGFHILLAKASRNPLFEMIQESISRIVYTFLQKLKTDVEYSTRVVRYHKEIYKAIKNRDEGKAQRLMQEHILDVTGKLAELAEDRKSKRQNAKRC